jgi:hypothetical protein
MTVNRACGMKESLAVRIKRAEAELRKDLQKRAQELYDGLSGKNADFVAPGAPPPSECKGETLHVFYDAVSMERACRLGSWAPAAYIFLDAEGCAQKKSLRDICYGLRSTPMPTGTCIGSRPSTTARK